MGETRSTDWTNQGSRFPGLANYGGSGLNGTLKFRRYWVPDKGLLESKQFYYWNLNKIK